MLADQAIAPTGRIVEMTGPEVLRRLRHQPSPYRVELDIALARQDIVLHVDDAGPEPGLPKGTGAAMDGVDHPDEAPAKVLHSRADGAGLQRGNEEMNVVPHEDVRVNLAAALHCRVPEALEVEATIRIAKEAGAAIVPALDDMVRNAAQLEPRWPGHGTSTRAPPKGFRAR